MGIIFVSHSQYDTNIRNFFGNIIGSVKGMNPLFMEFENIERYPAQVTKENIGNEDTRAVFVLLGPNITGTEYTRSWVAFEVGVATALKKDIWVFEPFNENIMFPVPFLNHYVLYELGNRDYFNFTKEIVSIYKRTSLFGLRKSIIEYMSPHPITCDYCKASYTLHSRVRSFKCPVCLKTLTFRI